MEFMSCSTANPSGQADRRSDTDQHESLAHHQAQHVGAERAKCRAYADLAGSAADVVGHQSVQASDGQRQPHGAHGSGHVPGESWAFHGMVQVQLHVEPLNDTIRNGNPRQSTQKTPESSFPSTASG